jgi:lipoprotein-anchoring transpeptidase ErfK/SrfK
LRDPGYREPFDRDDGFDPLPDREPGAVVRAPLDDSMAAAPPAVEDGNMIIDGQPSAIPDVTQPPQMSLSGASEDIARIQIALDRSGTSPGVIDGRIGDNVNKAISAYRDLTGETMRTYDKDYVQSVLQETGGDAFVDYEITAVDVAGPFVASVPADYSEKARLERLGFVSVAEMLAERFHMDERYLRELNAGVDFDRPGTIIKVANVGEPLSAEVTRIVADKGARQVRAYDEDGDLVAVYPSTIGSAATPSPTGTHKVERIALDPQYTYNPKINFKQGDNDEVLTIPPGPNGPVGTVWIALSKPTYGIHGTPDPSKIGKTESNGCIRLTNWDAQELAKMVDPGTTVEFVE